METNRKELGIWFTGMLNIFHSQAPATAQWAVATGFLQVPLERNSDVQGCTLADGTKVKGTEDGPQI